MDQTQNGETGAAMNSGGLILANGTGDPDPTTTFQSAAIGQVVAMMGEDLRAYLQSLEQIYVAASAKALAMIVDPATASSGMQLLGSITVSQNATNNFSQNIVQVAKSFSGIK